MTRRPVFDKSQRVWAYELVFRAKAPPESALLDAEDTRVVDLAEGFGALNLAGLTDGKRAMITVPPDLIGEDEVARLPRDKTVLLLTKDVPLDIKTAEACRKYKRAGYRVCLDAFGPDDPRQPLTRFVDMLRVDFSTGTLEDLAALADQYHLVGLDVVAGDLRSPGDFEKAQKANFDLFQGQFFRTLDSGGLADEIPAYKVNYLTLLQEVHSPELDLAAVERVVKQDVSLTYRLLSYINSAAFGLRNHVKSIRQALVLLGSNGVRRWGSLISVTCLGKDRPSELMICSLIRARFCEGVGISLRMKEQEQELFLLGLFSLIDAIAGRPMVEMLDQIPLSPPVKEALLGGPDLESAVRGRHNRMRDVLDLVIAYEEGDWDSVSETSEKLGVDEELVPDLYISSLEWSRKILHGGRSAT